MSGLTKDTPILIQHGGEISFYYISQLPGLFNVYIKDCENELILFKTKHSLQNEKDLLKGLNFPYVFIPTQDLFVWSDSGFTKIKKVIKQFYPRSTTTYYTLSKSCYHITTESGKIDITENQYLLTHDNHPIYPNDMKVGMDLYHTDLPTNIEKFNFDNIINQEKQFSEEKDNLHDTKEHHELKKSGNNIVSITTTHVFRDFVYRLETENPNFSAGIGRLVVPSFFI